MNKTFEIEVKARRPGGGRIVISTGTLDRDRDRVLPTGAILDGYRKNPIVAFGHNYSEPWAVAGRTTALDVTPAGIEAEFELRPAANDADPQSIVRLLWEGRWLRGASIGFLPLEWNENEHGGRDFTKWELLEWSLVPIPANQEALAMVAKALGDGDAAPLTKSGADVAYNALARKEHDMERLLSGLAGLLKELNTYLRGGKKR